MTAAMNAKRVKFNSNLAKHLAIVDPSLGYHFSVQIKRNYDFCYDEPQMKKKASTSCDIASRFRAKIKWLELCKSTLRVCASLNFLIKHILYKALNYGYTKQHFVFMYEYLVLICLW